MRPPYIRGNVQKGARSHPPNPGAPRRAVATDKAAGDLARGAYTGVREHDKSPRTPLVPFFNIPFMNKTTMGVVGAEKPTSAWALSRKPITKEASSQASAFPLLGWDHALKEIAFWGLVLIVGLGLYGCGQQKASSPEKAQNEGKTAHPPLHQTIQHVQVIKPQRRDITFTLTLPADIAPWYQVTMYAKVPGYLKWIGFDKGDAVKKGELLAEIDAPEIRDAFQQAETDFRIKQLTYERLSAIWNANPDVIAKQDVDMAEAAAKAAEHQRNSRRILLDYTKIYAPFSGIITARFADPGSLIQAATGSASQAIPLVTIMDINQVRVYVNVPQESALMAMPGVPLTLLVNELPGQEFTGSITRRTEALDPDTRTLLVEADIRNPHHRLRPGMYGYVTLQLAHHENALAIPPGAIGEDVKRAADFVYVIEKGKKRRVPIQLASVFVVHDETVRRVPIKVGIDDGVWVEVLDGLHEDDEVVVVGKSGLKEGDQIVASAYKLPAGEHEVQKL